MMMKLLALFCAAAFVPGSLSLSDEEFLSMAVENKHLYPVEMHDDFTFEALKKFHTVSHVEIVHPEMKQTLTFGPKENLKLQKELKWFGDKNSTLGGNVDPTKIIAVGKDAWKLVEDNKPSVDLAEDWAGALPSGVDAFSGCYAWKNFDSNEYKYSFKNFLGFELTRFDWRFSFKYNGKLRENDVGKYVSGAGASVSDVWAYLSENIECSLHAMNPANYGEKKTAPVAGIDLKVACTSYGKFERTVAGCYVTVRGDGVMEVHSCDMNEKKD